MKGAGRWIWPLAILVAALIFWTVFLGQAEESVFGRVPILDEVYYLDQAAAWISDPSLPPEPFFVSPLYPLLIVLAGSGESVPDSRVFPPDQLRGIRIFQIGCWLGVVILLRLIAGRVLGRDMEPGWEKELLVWLPAVLFALYLPAAVYTMSILLELPLVLLITTAVYLMTCLVDRPRKDRVFGRGMVLPLALGVVLGLAGLLRGTVLLLLVPALVVAAGKAGGYAAGRWDRFGRALLMLGAVLVVLSTSETDRKPTDSTWRWCWGTGVTTPRVASTWRKNVVARCRRWPKPTGSGAGKPGGPCGEIPSGRPDSG